MIIGGEESGGNIAAAVAFKARDHFANQLDGQVLISPLLDPFMGTASFRKADAIGMRQRWAEGWSHYLSGGVCHPYAAPCTCSRLSDIAPALVLSAEDDPLLDETKKYAERLKSAGVKVHQHVLPAGTGWASIYGGTSGDAPIWQRPCANSLRPLSGRLAHNELHLDELTKRGIPRPQGDTNDLDRKRWALAGAGLGLAASVSAAVFFLDMSPTKAVAAAATAEMPAIPVTVAVVNSRDIDTWQEFSGRLEAVDRVAIRSRVAGAIKSVDFREGALVKTGDLLFTIDPAPYEAAVAQAQGQVASANARVSLAKLESERGKRLSANQTISQSDLDQRQNALTEAQAGLQTAQAALHAAELELGYTKVRAPVTGRVGKVEVTAGNLIAAGSASSVLTTLVSVDPIYASFSVAEEVVARALAKFAGLQRRRPPH